MRRRLHSIATTAGFLEHCPVEFAPGLTCIIGARGTCKSTLVESIRFAFDSDPDRVAALLKEADAAGESTAGKVRATLGAGSVRCEVVAEDDAGGTRFLIEREVGADGPRISVDGVREHAQRELLHDIEIFSQGDLQRIADAPSDEMRLDLIDRPHKPRIAKLKAERLEAAVALLRVGPQLRSLRAQVASLRQEVQPAAALREQLRHASDDGPAVPPELEAEHARFERRTKVLAALKEAEAVRAGLLAQLQSQRGRAQHLTALVASARAEADVDVGSAAAALDAAEGAAADVLAAMAALDAVALLPAIDGLSAEFERLSEPYYRLRQEQQVFNESLKRRQHLQRQVDHLDRREQELRSALADEQRLLEERLRARDRIARIDNEIFTLRIAEVDAINAEHGGAVYLTLRTGTGAPRYLSRLSALLGGSGIRKQDEVARALGETFAPDALVDVVESGTGQRFADVLKRDIGQMNRVVAHLSEHAELYQLEAEPPAAQLEITLFDKGEPKKVETLSKGQRATALLPLILRPLPYPLIFDQPEDDLDNSFIFHWLIEAVRKLKARRQVIFVTHNANIPVLGGADRVVVMHMRTPKQAEAPRCGTVDERKGEILELLEGGREAFMLREERYKDLLHGAPAAARGNGGSNAQGGQAGGPATGAVAGA